MNFLAPLAFGLAVLVGPLLALYMLRSQRHRMVVPSLLLWEQVDASVSSARPWERLRWSPLLILQIVTILLFALALARPFVSQRTLLGPHTVIVVDTSASMGQAGRFEAAVAEARSLVEDVSEARLVSIIDAGPQARVLAAFTPDPDLAADAIDELVLTGGGDSLGAAIRLARGLATPERPTRTIVLSDGGSAEIPGEPFPDVVHVPFDATAANVGFGLFAPSPSVRGTAVVGLSNVDDGPATVDVVVEVDGEPRSQHSWDVGAMGRARREVPFDATPGQVVTIRRIGDPDGSPHDDSASFVVPSQAVVPVSVSGEDSFFIPALLAADPGAELVDDGAVVIANGGTVPDSAAWLIRTEPPAGIERTGVAQNLRVGFQRPGEPLLDGVDLSEVVVGEADVVVAPGWLVLASSGDVPLILIGEVDGQPTAYFTFSLEHSNLPVETGFPILGRNLIEWLAGGAGARGAVAPVGVPLPVDPTGATVELPDGRIVEALAGSPVFAATGQPGVYRVTDSAGATVAHARALDPAELEVDARPIATTTGDGGGDSLATTASEVAPWAVGTLLVFVLLEWWIAHRRTPTRRPTPRGDARPSPTRTGGGT